MLEQDRRTRRRLKAERESRVVWKPSIHGLRENLWGQRLSRGRGSEFCRGARAYGKSQ